jgi:hypothetical protein
VRGEYRHSSPDSYRLSADVDYEGNRFTAYGYHFEDRSAGPKDISRDSFIQINGAIAFADGAIAIGKQVSGSGYAIVQPDKDESSTKIYVNDWGGSDYRARTGALGPALVTNLVPYINDTLEISSRSILAAKNGQSENTQDDKMASQIGTQEKYCRAQIFAFPFGGVVILPRVKDEISDTSSTPDCTRPHE